MISNSSYSSYSSDRLNTLQQFFGFLGILRISDKILRIGSIFQLREGVDMSLEVL